MDSIKLTDHERIEKINHMQRDFFGKITHIFDPPLPEGVPERLETIVASAQIVKKNAILDVGSGTGILIPLIHKYHPEIIYACDLSEAMLKRLKEHYPYAQTVEADIKDLSLPDQSIDVAFVNACYSNIADKQGFCKNMGRMIKTGGRLVISHPMGKSFIDLLRDKSPFPLDDFPAKPEAEKLLTPFGFSIKQFTDQPELYILVAQKKAIGYFSTRL